MGEETYNVRRKKVRAEQLEASIREAEEEDSHQEQAHYNAIICKMTCGRQWINWEKVETLAKILYTTYKVYELIDDCSTVVLILTGVGTVAVAGKKVLTLTVKEAIEYLGKRKIEKVVLDANTIIMATKKGQQKALKQLIGNRQVLIPKSVMCEYVTKGGEKEFKKFAKEFSVEIVEINANEAKKIIKDFQSHVERINKNRALRKMRANPRVIHPKDALVSEIAINKGATLITRDSRLKKNLEFFGKPVVKWFSW